MPTHARDWHERLREADRLWGQAALSMSALGDKRSKPQPPPEDICAPGVSFRRRVYFLRIFNSGIEMMKMETARYLGKDATGAFAQWGYHRIDFSRLE